VIKFKSANHSGSIYVNPALVTWIVPNHDQTTLYFGPNFIEVQELEDAVIAKLYGAELDKYTRTGDYSRL
jgi:hypothetical protein